jgi:hypothetical protein
MTIYRDNYPSNIESPQKLFIEYSHDIAFDYSTGRYPDGTESQWHWENNYIPIVHQINGLQVGRHEWMRIKVGEPAFWTYPIRMSANITNIQTIESEIEEETGEFSFTIKLTFEDGSTKESDPITIKNGVDGVEIVSSQINEDGYLIITYSDGRVENAGMAKGSDSTGIPLTGPDDSVLSISGNIPVWIMPLQVLNASLIANTPLTYDINTGDLEINQADTDTDGYLSSTDWNTFNNKIDNTHPANSITNTDITNLGNLSGTNTGDVNVTYQTLVSSASISMNIENGLNAKLNLAHNATLTLTGLASGDEGNIEVIQGATDYTLALIPTPYVLNDGGSTIELLSGAGNVTVISYSYDGTTLLVTYNKLSEETDPVFTAWLLLTPPAYPEDIPTSLSELSEDSTHRTVTDAEKSAWNSYKEIINCYIVGSTPLASDWLSLTVGGATLTPATEKIYIILTAGDYANTQYRWDGSSAYVSFGGGTTFNLATAIHAATAETEILDADELPFWKAVGTALRKITWTNIKTTLGAGLAFLSSAITIKGSSTGKTALASANTGANDYTATFPAKNITVAGLDDITGGGYDATIGTGGQYATILSAQTTLGRDCILKAVGNIADPGALTTIGYRVIVNLNGYSMTFTNNRVTVTSGKYLECYNGIITLDGNPANIVFSCTSIQDLYMHDLTVNCAQTASNCPFMYNGRVERLLGICSTNQTQTFLASNNGYGFIGWAKNIILKVTNELAAMCIGCNGYIEDLTVVYGNVALSTSGVIWMYSEATGRPAIKKLTNISGVALTVMCYYGVLELATGTNITIKLANGVIGFTVKDSILKAITKQAGTSGTLKVIGTSVVDAIDLTQADRNIALDMDSRSSLASNLSINSMCNIEGRIGGSLAITGNSNQVKPGTRIVGITNILGNYNNVQAAFLESVITLLATGAGSAYNDISHCYLNASYVDNNSPSTNTFTNNRP